MFDLIALLDDSEECVVCSPQPHATAQTVVLAKIDLDSLRDAVASDG